MWRSPLAYGSPHVTTAGASVGKSSWLMFVYSIRRAYGPKTRWFGPTGSTDQPTASKDAVAERTNFGRLHGRSEAQTTV
ncbi:hypothetical protein JCM18237_15020 [Halorubrum luteum]